MKEYFSALWLSESRFRAAVRGCIALAGAIVPLFPGIPDWVAPIVIALAMFLPAGERNIR